MVQMPESNPVPVIETFVAIGDSFTEGLGDQAPGGGLRGWADMTAAALAAQRPGFRYANLAIRGKLLGQVAAEQVPRAVEMAPDLVSLAAGGNDILRGDDVDTLAADFEPAVAKLQAAGSRVRPRLPPRPQSPPPQAALSQAALSRPAPLRVALSQAAL